MSFRDLIIYLVIAGDIGIVFGYIYIAIMIAPKLLITNKHTKYGGIGFFIFCALTHMDLVFHAANFGYLWSNVHLAIMALICIPQVFAIWVFIAGLNKEFIIPKVKIRRK